MKLPRARSYAGSVAVIAVLAAALAACDAKQDAPRPGRDRPMTYGGGKVHHALLIAPEKEARAPPGAM